MYDFKSIGNYLYSTYSVMRLQNQTFRQKTNFLMGRAKRVPLISPRRIQDFWRTCAHCFILEEEVRTKDFFGSNLFSKKVAIQCNFFHISRVIYPLFHRFEPMFLLLLITRYFFLQRLFLGQQFRLFSTIYFLVYVLV